VTKSTTLAVNTGIAKIFEVNDTSYLLLVGASSNTGGTFIVQTDTNFNIRWTKTPFANIISSVNNYWDACFSYDRKSIAISMNATVISYVSNGSFFARVNLNGDLITYKSTKDPFSNFDSLYNPASLFPTPENGFIIGANLFLKYTDTIEAGNIEVTDSNFNFLRYYKVKSAIIGSIVLNKDYSITASGTRSDTINNGMLRIVKIDSTGNYIHSGINQTQPENAYITIYPNPAMNELKIETNISTSLNNQPEKLTAQLFDITGKLILQDSFIQNLTFNIQHCMQGIYFLRITDTNTGAVSTRKVIIMR